MNCIPLINYRTLIHQIHESNPAQADFTKYETLIA